MQLQLTTNIAGRKTVADWKAIRENLDKFDEIELWSQVFNDYFLTRLNDRYINPIQSIKMDGRYSGEGFSIMTIICSLIEFLEATYQGINYRYRRNGDPPLGQFEYTLSGQLFTDFLTNRVPFAAHFDVQTSKDFYSNVRCGLLHEARTNGKWTIWGKSGDNKLIEKISNEIVVYRDEFYDALLNYINDIYRAELLSSKERKAAFLRKYDRLCEE